MKSTPFIIVRDPFEARQIHGRVPKGAMYLCTNRKTLDQCLAMGQDAFLLTEDMLGEHLAEINDWSYRSAIDLVHLLKREGDVKQNIFWESNFYTLKGVLVQSAKFIRVIDSLIQKHKFDKFYWVNNWPSLLVKTCKEYIAHFQPAIQVIELSDTEPIQAMKNGPDFKMRLRQGMSFFTNVLSRILLGLILGEKKKNIFISGALNHLRGVILLLHANKSYRLVYLEDNFNLEKFLFCLKRAIPYIILTKNKKGYNPFAEERSRASLGVINFCDLDYTVVFNEIFDFALNSGILCFSVDYDFLDKIYRELRPSGVLLDEDLSLERRSLAVFAWHREAESFVVSHGVPIQHLKKETPRDRYLASSFTIVNSEFEQEVYKNLYFDPRRLVVLGIPRYDNIVMLKKNSGKPGNPIPKNIKTVLLCLAGFRDYDFDAFMTVLVQADSIGQRDRTYIKELLQAVAGRPDVLVKIKTHYVREEEAVIDYIHSLNVGAYYRIVSHRANMFQLESEADLIVTPESTVIVEGVLFSKPVLVMSYNKPNFFTVYKDNNFVRYVRCIKELQSAITDVAAQDKGRGTHDLNGLKSSGYFSKYHDGKNAQRVADFILSHTNAPCTL